MNALELLKADHDRVAELFEEFKADEDGNHKELFKKIKAELETHMHIEETIFYRKMKAEGDEELRKNLLEGIEEHRQVKMFLREMENMSDDGEKFNAKLKVVVEDVEHHKEEEEGEMFPLVEAQFSEDVLEQLGSELEAEKNNFQRSSTASAK